ncbi:MAG: DUF1207 domain-containing protein [Deltaproteobacteria bacterium]|nr:DUF1207 domain-containing protein [Deltaproteobacteria bacterium]
MILLLCCWASISAVQAAQPSDEFIRGYATAIIAEHFPSGVKTIRVYDGVIYMEGGSLGETEKSEIQKILLSVEGVTRVEFVADRTEAVVRQSEEQLPLFLPSQPLFQALLADPRWPHFSISYQHYLGNDLLRNVAAAGFGESIGIYRFQGPWDSTMELGVHAGVFSIFDMSAQSFDLINADYLFGIPITLKKGDFTNMFRIFHQSSHLGDEFLLRGETDERINLSYEGVDNLLSYHLPAGFRIYAGGGYLIRKSPSDLDPWSTQAGLEFRSPATWLEGALRPVASVDVQNRQETNWITDISVRTGIQLENPNFLSRKVLLLLEYYNGKSPNGQFYEHSIEFLGIGVHLFF